MKRNAFITSLLLSVTTYSHVFGGEYTQISKAEPRLSLKTRDSIEVGLQNYWYKYEEKVHDAFFMSNTGTKYGVSLTGTKNLGDDYYIIGDARYATGDVNYESASGTGRVSDDMYELRTLVGKEALVENYLLSSYIGAGYRCLNNDLRDLGSGGYRRTSKYLYIPIGVMHRFKVDYYSRISSSIEYDYFAWGEQKSYMSDISPAVAAIFGDPVNKQKHGYGVRLNTAYEQNNWSIGVFFNYWNIGDSEKNYYIDPPFLVTITEPKNETKELGLQIKYRF